MAVSRFASLILALAALAGACASIPHESIDLSRSVGEGIVKSREAHMATLDAFYHRLKADNDDWIVNTFYPKAVRDARTALATACAKVQPPAKDCDTLSERDLQVIMRDTIQFRDEIQLTLETNHDQVVQLIDEHYNSLQAANAGVTGLLTSAVKVKDATRDATATLTRATGLSINPDEIESAFDQFLQKAGNAGTKVTDLQQQLSTVVEKFKKPTQ
jgi:hypothetical protein